MTEAERRWGAYLSTFSENTIRAFCKGDIIEYQGQKYLYDGNHGLISLEDTDQTAKADAGKPRLSIVPIEIINCIARVREYGVTKYTDPDNWKRVEVERYHDALFRHVIAYINDPASVDEESGLPHLWHICANCAFLCELEKKK
jgi:hypothetical protein